MSVYVDEPVHPFGRMLMCHMMADTPEELLAMADHIGVSRRWLQRAGEWCEHFDVCKAKRKLAVAAGAVEITARMMVRAARARAEHRALMANDSTQPALPAVPHPPQSPAAGSAAHVEDKP